ncbi:MAG: alpha/beta fold hydrolase [Candidatus Kapabacteria bacterium]|nr:alpha/beta fold hydrolase [Candidatus Kapabacteria bacterium]
MKLTHTVLSLGACLVAIACSSVPNRLVGIKQCPAVRAVTTMKVLYPIVLLHGLGQKADVWHGTATSYFTRDLGLSYGGDLRVDSNGVLNNASPNGGDADFYTVAFSDPHDSVNAWRDELEICITHILTATGADRVILVGYSMGGLAARAYLVKKLTDHRVKRLITIGTPHLGSPFANIWTWKSELEKCVREQNVVLSQPCRAALSAIQGAEGDVPFDAPAVRDLRRPEDGGDYLRRLSKYAHPLDVEYVSVIGEVDLLDEIKNLRSGSVQEILRKVLSMGGGSFTEIFESGDGVVSAKSQDIMNIEYFTVDKSRRRTTRDVNVASVHVDHLAKNTDIQRMMLDDKAEYKGAIVCLENGVPTLTVDVADHIPEQCSVTVDVLGAATQRFVAARGTAQLCRTADGIVARFSVPLEGVSTDSSTPYTLKIIITNTFGYTTTASIMW